MSGGGRGLLVRDAENDYLEMGAAPGMGIKPLLGHSIAYRIAVRPNEGRKAFMLQTVWPPLEAP